MPRNLNWGAELYRAAAAQGDEWACYLLGLCYSDGIGVKLKQTLGKALVDKGGRRWSERGKKGPKVFRLGGMS